MKKRLCALLALLLALSLTACGGGITAMDAADYVQGLMDKTYLGQFNESYLTSVDIDEKTARENYLSGLEVEYEYFASFFQFDEDYVTQASRQNVIDLLADFYLNAKYQVKAGSKAENGYTVEVVVSPIDIIPLVTENYLTGFAEEFRARYADVTQEDVDAMSAEEQDAFWLSYENDWVDGIVALFRAHLSELGYLDEVSIAVQFKPDESGVYSISDNDFANLDALVLAYSY